MGWLMAVVLLSACTASVAPPAAPGSIPPQSVVSEATGSPPSASEPPLASETPLASDPLHAVELIDITGQTPFTLGMLAADGPVLLETMAIWCSSCRAQQHDVVATHQLATFTSVSLDVDPNERPADLAAYALAMGFNWRFAMANQELASLLRDRFGPAVLNPPSTPMILLFPDGSLRALEFRRYSPAELAAEIAAG